MKTLKNKIFAGALILTTLGFFGQAKNTVAQNPNSLHITIIDTLNKGQVNQQVWASGYTPDNKWVAFVGCNSYKANHYTGRYIHGGKESPKTEEFMIDDKSGLMNYRMYVTNPYKEIIEFKDLTREQIYQDKEFAEKIKRITNACESKTKLREMVKEVYEEREILKIPKIKQ